MADIERHGQLTPKLVDGLYVEAMVLADEARSYFDTAGRDDRLALDPIDRVGFSCESLKVTTRLMHVIAWLLTQRAVAAGELSPVQAGDAERRLGDAPDTDAALFPRLPRGRGRARPGERGAVRPGRPARRRAASPTAPAGSPARSLLSRLQRSLLTLPRGVRRRTKQPPMQPYEFHYGPKLIAGPGAATRLAELLPPGPLPVRHRRERPRAGPRRRGAGRAARGGRCSTRSSRIRRARR